MELIVDRKWKKQSYTISNLTIDGKWFSNILEDTDNLMYDPSDSIESNNITDDNGNYYNTYYNT